MYKFLASLPKTNLLVTPSNQFGFLYSVNEELVVICRVSSVGPLFVISSMHSSWSILRNGWNQFFWLLKGRRRCKLIGELMPLDFNPDNYPFADMITSTQTVKHQLSTRCTLLYYHT